MRSTSVLNVSQEKDFPQNNLQLRGAKTRPGALFPRVVAVSDMQIPGTEYIGALRFMLYQNDAAPCGPGSAALVFPRVALKPCLELT
jgi:hypothetical protein